MVIAKGDKLLLTNSGFALKFSIQKIKDYQQNKVYT